MAGTERLDAFALMKAFRFDEPRLGDALTLFVEREDYGFVWLAYRADALVGCASVGYAISTGAGGVVAVVRDLYVVPGARRSGVATALIEALRARLAALDIARLEIATSGDAALLAFLAARGYTVSSGIFTARR